MIKQLSPLLEYQIEINVHLAAGLHRIQENSIKVVIDWK